MAIEFKEYSEEVKKFMVHFCEKCIFVNNEELCNQNPCMPNERVDEKDGYYIEVPD